jgi:hypothetical protein
MSWKVVLHTGADRGGLGWPVDRLVAYLLKEVEAAIRKAHRRGPRQLVVRVEMEHDKACDEIAGHKPKKRKKTK